MIVLSGEPKSTQHIYRASCHSSFPNTYMKLKGKALREQYQCNAKTQWEGEPIQDDVELTATFYFGTKRRACLVNFNKLHLDALPGEGDFGC